MRLGFIVQLAFAVPVQLLRQQVCRTRIRAGATAYTTFLFLRFAHLRWGRGEQAVGNLHHRDIQPRQGKAHQRATHNDQLIATRAEASLFQQMTHRRTQTRPDVAGTGDGLAGQRDDAFGQWLAVNHRTFYRVGSTHVLHQHADVGRTAPVGDLFAGQDLRQLF